MESIVQGTNKLIFNDATIFKIIEDFLNTTMFGTNIDPVQVIHVERTIDSTGDWETTVTYIMPEEETS